MTDTTLDLEEQLRRLCIGPYTTGMPEILSPQAAHERTNVARASLLKNWQLLHDILERHEAVIQKRWRKKSRTQRVQLLLTAWPKMSPHHRPDLRLERQMTAERRASRTGSIEAYMWPHISQEDLTKAHILPLFMNARGRNRPDTFKVSDYRAAVNPGMTSGAIVPPLLSEHTMYMSGNDFPAHYGELVAWADSPDALDALRAERAVAPGHGILILEIQQRIYRFLVDCCNHVLHDISDSDLTSGKYPIQPKPPLPEDTTTEFAPLAVMAAEAPYRTPLNPDMPRLRSLFAAKLSAIEDHAWALREDPGYFVDNILELKENTPDPNRVGRSHQHLTKKTHGEGILWESLVSDVVVSAYGALDRWQELQQRANDFANLQEERGGGVMLQNGRVVIPIDYATSLLEFTYHLEMTALVQLASLNTGIACSPPLRSYLMQDGMGDSGRIGILLKKGVRLDNRQTHLLKLLDLLCREGGNLPGLTLVDIVDELNCFLHAEPKMKEMISPYISDILSDLSLVIEATRQVGVVLPWVKGFEASRPDIQLGIKQQCVERIASWSYLCDPTEGPSQARRLGIPSGKRFYYPVDKRMTKANVEAMRSAEQNLDAFWAALDGYVQGRDGNDRNKAIVQRLLSQPRKLQRTPEWIEPTKAATQSASLAKDASVKPLSEMYRDLEYRTEQSVDRSTSGIKKTKAKTRSTTTLLDETDDRTNEQPLPDDPSSEPPPTILVNARAHKVFQTIFYTPSVNGTPGEIAWHDFLSAMTYVGFAPEKLYGSVWQFRSTRTGLDRSIQFHEPHPIGKIAYRVARTIGRRLERAYGWTGSTFELSQDKKGDKGKAAGK